MEVFSYTKCIVIVLDDTYGIDKIYTKKNDIFDAFRLARHSCFNQEPDIYAPIHLGSDFFLIDFPELGT
jgi:hypothetical protein